uniref:VWFA domain-containing protein n=1 Tax=Terrapene triunguis TaxID=2587831 RepID=A0A674ITU2_9SAUR
MSLCHSPVPSGKRVLGPGVPSPGRNLHIHGEKALALPHWGSTQESPVTPSLSCAQVCGPTAHQTCGENMLDGQMSWQFHCHLVSLGPSKCPKRPTDIVFLIDGSGSIDYRDFETMKTFVIEVIRRFRGTNTLFALAQFSSSFWEHFDFNKFKSTHDIDSLVHQVRQLGRNTYTATAIQKVVRELFISRKGSRDGAARILIVVTDGMKNDNLRYSDVIPEAERAGIIRYAIGVGDAFSQSSAQRELHEIASNPTNEHIFQVNDFDALRGIQNQLQEKIFAIEGTQSQSGSSFQLEMSQDGFSSLLSPDGPVLGAVGAYDWSGGIYLYGSSGEPSFINVSRASGDMKDAYLGYSVQVIRSRGRSSYVVGAPRHNHIGKVILFRQDAKRGGWREETEVLGEQVGSYFGGTLCAVDLNGDGNTDLVLIGAPMYYTPLNGGRVYICPINQQGPGWGICGKTLQGQAFGHFGASMSEIGDISGDGRRDVAIGAPMENDNRGALYIFHGEKGGLNPQYRQRIEGSQFPSRLHYFGRAVSGGTDLTGDGLPDIAVGAQGQVLLLRSRPVLKVEISISFQPPTIPTSAFDCQEQEQLNTESLSVPHLSLIFPLTPVGDRIFSTIQYSLALDPGRTKIRAAFDSSGPVLSRELRLGIGKKCETYRITLPLCPEDTVTPITLRLNYTLKGEPIAAANRLRPILSEDSAPMSAGSLPFQKDCGTDGRCDDQLEISFNFSGLSTLVVGVTPELNTTVSIQNRGENSYSTRVQFFYPAALSYRRVLLLQVPQHGAGSAGDAVLQGAGRGFGRGLCFFQVKNLRQRSVPISVTFQFPVELSGVRVWDASEVVPSKVPASPCPCVSPPAGTGCLGGKDPCPSPQQPLEFMIKGNVSFQWVSQTQQQKVSLVSEARIEYEEKKYTQKEGFVQRQVQTVVERYEVYNYLPIIVGSSMGGLVLLALITAALYKFGFFKRQYKQMMEDGVEGEGPGPTQSAAAGNPPVSDAPKQ